MYIFQYKYVYIHHMYINTSMWTHKCVHICLQWTYIFIHAHIVGGCFHRGDSSFNIAHARAQQSAEEWYELQRKRQLPLVWRASTKHGCWLPMTKYIRLAFRPRDGLLKCRDEPARSYWDRENTPGNASFLWTITGPWGSPSGYVTRWLMKAESVDSWRHENCRVACRVQTLGWNALRITKAWRDGMCMYAWESSCWTGGKPAQQTATEWMGRQCWTQPWKSHNLLVLLVPTRLARHAHVIMFHIRMFRIGPYCTRMSSYKGKRGCVSNSHDPCWDSFSSRCNKNRWWYDSDPEKR